MKDIAKAIASLPTPRTDAAEWTTPKGAHWVVNSNLCRSLEQRLAMAVGLLERIEPALDWNNGVTVRRALAYLKGNVDG